jgi:phage terminase large subunit GpA-like protein
MARTLDELAALDPLIPPTWSIPPEVWEVWKPPPRLSVSAWADAERFLSAESSSEPGRWRTHRAEYQRAILDAFSDPALENVVVQSSAQVGKTEILNNVVGYFIDQDPSPMQVVYPDIKMAEAWSKDRFTPMARDTPALRGKIADAKSRSAENRILHKRFAGGHLTISGSNAPASLASRPIRIVLCDECDRFPLSAGTEGDPIALVRKRSTTFWNRKLGLFSTPTVRGRSRIEAAYLESDRRVYAVPCPACSARQVLRWGQVKFENRRPETAAYECESPKCRERWGDAARWRAVRFGTWAPTATSTNRTAGFHLNELVSPWVDLASVVDGHLRALNSRERRRAWVNLSLGETFQDDATEVEATDLASRRERYAAEVPAPVVLLLGAVDVQGNRLEATVVGVTEADPPELYVVRHVVVPKPPTDPTAWADVLALLTREWEHEDGVAIKVAAAAVDTGGHYSLEAYRFCKVNAWRRIYAIRGTSGAGKQAIGRPSRANALNVSLYTVNVDTFKAQLFERLAILPRGPEPGQPPPEFDGDSPPAHVATPGRIHFAEELDDEWFEQVTAERLEPRYSHGVATYVWRKTRQRNEALDLLVYCLVTLAILRPNLREVARRFRARVAKALAARHVDSAGGQEPKQPADEGVVEREPDRERRAPDSARRKRSRGRSWLHGWKR